MGARTVRELLNRLRWSEPAGSGDVSVGILERGDGGERVTDTPFAALVEILPGGVSLAGDTFIPYHRLRYVRRGEAWLWLARERGETDEG